MNIYCGHNYIICCIRYMENLIKEALATILTKKNMFWKLVNSFKMMK
jgi:hypothetical protein